MWFTVQVVRAHVPRMNLDELFEQKGEVAKAVSEELEKVYPLLNDSSIVCRYGLGIKVPHVLSLFSVLVSLCD